MKFVKVTTWALMAAISLASASRLSACAWSEDWEGAFYRFFDPEFATVESYKPFHFTFDRLYDYELLEQGTSTEANLSAWGIYFGTKYTKADLKQMVYEIPLKDMERLYTDVLTAKPVSKQYAANPMVKDWVAGKHLDVLDYLVLAHRAEPLCNYEWDEWSGESPSMDGAPKLVEAGLQGAQKGKDAFVKLRFAYQAMRLQHYTEAYQAAVETYRNHVLPNAAADPLLANWCRAHYAGCLRNMEEEAEAAYQFSRVFDECPSRRIQAWYGWRILSDDIWYAVESKCKSNHERAVIYFLRAFSPNAIAMSDMRRIHDLDPGSQLLDVLLLREINKLENNILGYPYGVDASVDKRLSREATAELLDVVNMVLASGKMHDRNIWELGQIYLRFLGDDVTGAQQALAAKMPTLTGDGQLRGRLMDLVFRIGSTRSVDKNVENAIYKDFTNLSSKLEDSERDELGRFRDEAFSWVYRAQGEIGKSLLAADRAYAVFDYPINLDLVNDLLQFEAKEDKTLYEKELLGRIRGEENTRDVLLDVKGTGLIGRNLLPEAIRVLEQVSPEYRKSDRFILHADPFRGVFTDVVNCESCGSGKYDKLTYAQRVVELQKEAATNPAKAGEAYMLLGNAYYNTSYFGPAWNAKDYYRSGGSWYNLGVHDEYYDFNQATFDEHVDMTHAMSYYAKALNNLKDKEQAAAAAFMLAKCELNQSYIDGASDRTPYLKGFASLKANYRKTDTYKDLIKECWYLAAYANER